MAKFAHVTDFKMERILDQLEKWPGIVRHWQVVNTGGGYTLIVEYDEIDGLEANDDTATE